MIQTLTDKLKNELSPKRLAHSIGVSQTATRLAKLYGADVQKAEIAGLMHDCAREMPKNILLKIIQSSGIVVDDVELCQPALLHARAGAVVVKRDYAIDDQEICQAISCHTVGGPQMTLLDKVIFLADCIEPGRKYPGVDKLRQSAKENLDKALLAAYDHTIGYLIAGQGLIHPAAVAGRNALLMKML
ncbi:MAG: putative superfamily hydrolase [Firmicutes bacterium]|nr:putative superfamily hydrolase [Bacillota bacterium]